MNELYEGKIQKYWYRDLVKDMTYTQKYIELIKKQNNGNTLIVYNNNSINYDNYKNIYPVHYNQTKEEIDKYKKYYENYFYYKNIDIWDLFYKLKDVYDCTDCKLENISQYAHCLQVYNGMLLNNETNKDLLALAFFHDLSKVYIKECNKDDIIWGGNKILDIDSIKRETGLMNATITFNHDEIGYIKFKKYLTEQMLFTIRFHSLDFHKDNRYFEIMNQKEKEHFNFLLKFIEYDQNTKSDTYIPEVNIDDIKNLLRSYIPNKFDF